MADEVTQTVQMQSDPNELEFKAIQQVYAALKGLSPAAMQRVLRYVFSVLPDTDAGVSSPPPPSPVTLDATQSQRPFESVKHPEREEPESAENEEEGDGISPIAQKWMRRNGLNSSTLENIFSLGLDEIDVVAKDVPGGTNKEKTHNVFLLKGVAAYLGSGTTRFTHDAARETCQHYGAWDSTNASKYLKSFAGEIAGDAEAGYQLTTRGLTAATGLIKQMSAENRKATS